MAFTCLDDFGRQRHTPAELLNRWIVPMDRRLDYLKFQTGGKIAVPFEVFVVFSTNLIPDQLGDEAFLRRIRYKMLMRCPEEEEFREIFRRFCADNALQCQERLLDRFIDKHYRGTKRPFRRCHPRDVISHAIDLIQFGGETARNYGGSPRSGLPELFRAREIRLAVRRPAVRGRRGLGRPRQDQVVQIVEEVDDHLRYGREPLPKSSSRPHGDREPHGPPAGSAAAFAAPLGAGQPAADAIVKGRDRAPNDMIDQVVVAFQGHDVAAPGDHPFGLCIFQLRAPPCPASARASASMSLTMRAMRFDCLLITVSEPR